MKAKPVQSMQSTARNALAAAITERDQIADKLRVARESIQKCVDAAHDCGVAEASGRVAAFETAHGAAMQAWHEAGRVGPQPSMDRKAYSDLTADLAERKASAAGFDAARVRLEDQTRALSADLEAAQRRESDACVAVLTETADEAVAAFHVACEVALAATLRVHAMRAVLNHRGNVSQAHGNASRRITHQTSVAANVSVIPRGGMLALAQTTLDEGARREVARLHAAFANFEDLLKANPAATFESAMELAERVPTAA
jgi:hypothetical protein